MKSSSLHLLLVGFLYLVCSQPNGLCAGVPFLQLSLEEAQEQAYQKDKLFFLYFTASWCMPCQWMEQETFQDPALSQYVSANYLAIKVDLSTTEGKLLQEQFEVRIIPTVLVFDALGHLVAERSSSQEATPLLRWLKRLDKPANHLDPRLHSSATSTPAMDSPQPELHFSRPALVPEIDAAPQPMLSQQLAPTMDNPKEEMLMVYATPIARDNVFTPRSADSYGIRLTGHTYNYSEGIRIVAEMERKHQQRVELHPLQATQFYLLLGNFETISEAENFLHYLERNDQSGTIVPIIKR